MSAPLPVGPLSPYVTPELLTQAPTGISWSTIPAGSSVTSEQKLAEQSNICARATAMVDQACNQPLRATTDTLLLYGPGVRVGVPGGGRPVKLILKRWPVLDVTAISVSPNRLPYSWSSVPSQDWSVAYPVAGMYGSSAPAAAGEGGQEVLLAPRWVNWDRGRDGYAIQVANVNGWPHAGITADADEGATELQVDDCTGWTVTSSLTGATGATGTVYDAGSQEVIHVGSASAAAGPGTLTLAAPLANGHAAGVMVSTMPPNTGWAAIMFCVAQALTRGATATTVHQIPGGPGGSAPSPGDWEKAARAMLASYARII